MAFIYRYCLRNSNDRNRLNLTIYEHDIIETLRDIFAHNLKDSRVLSNHFEFKLYKSVEHGKLCWMGRYLFQHFREYDFENYGFVRMPQEFYAFLYSTGSAEGDFNYCSPD